MLVNVGAVMGTVHHVERFVARGFSVRILSVLTHASEVPVLLVLSCLQFHVYVEILTLRELHDCPHLCHETCCSGQCPSPDKCTKGLYSLSMPSLGKGDAMSRGFKQHIAKQALIPKIYLKTILDLNFFLGIMVARVKHRSRIRNCICVNPKIWRKRFQLLKIMYLSTKISVNNCKSKEDLTNADLSLFGASKKKSFLASAKLLEESAIWSSHVFLTRSWIGLKFCSGQNLPLKQDCRDQNVSDLLCFFAFFSLSFLLSR